MKAGVRKEMQEKERIEKEAKEGTGKGLGGLLAYDDSDEEDSDGVGDTAKEGVAQKQGQQLDVSVGVDGLDGAPQAGIETGNAVVLQAANADVDEEARKEARRARAKEWAEKRRLQKLASGQDGLGQKEEGISGAVS